MRARLVVAAPAIELHWLSKLPAGRTARAARQWFSVTTASRNDHWRHKVRAGAGRCWPARGADAGNHLPDLPQDIPEPAADDDIHHFIMPLPPQPAAASELPPFLLLLSSMYSFQIPFPFYQLECVTSINHA
jgi:hypothetical protein